MISDFFQLTKQAKPEDCPEHTKDDLTYYILKVIFFQEMDLKMLQDSRNYYQSHLKIITLLYSSWGFFGVMNDECMAEPWVLSEVLKHGVRLRNLSVLIKSINVLY